MCNCLDQEEIFGDVRRLVYLHQGASIRKSRSSSSSVLGTCRCCLAPSCIAAAKLQHHLNHLFAALSSREEGQRPGIAGGPSSSFLPLSSAARQSAAIRTPVQRESAPTCASKRALSPKTEQHILGASVLKLSLVLHRAS